MFENFTKIFKKLKKKDDKTSTSSRNTAKERLHLVLMQDRANVSADFLELMKQEIIEVIKKYIDVDESAIDVRLTNKENEDGTNGAPALYANIPIVNIKNETRKLEINEKDEENEEEIKNEEEKIEEIFEEKTEQEINDIKEKYTDDELQKIKENAKSIIEENTTINSDINSIIIEENDVDVKTTEDEIKSE